MSIHLHCHRPVRRPVTCQKHSPIDILRQRIAQRRSQIQGRQCHASRKPRKKSGGLFSKIGNFFKKAFKGITNLVKKPLQSIMKPLQGLLKPLSGLLKPISKLLSNPLVGMALTALGGPLGAAAGMIGKGLGVAGGLIGKGVGMASSLLGKGAGALGGLLKGPASMIGNLLGKGNGLLNKVLGPFNPMQMIQNVLGNFFGGGQQPGQVVGQPAPGFGGGFPVDPGFGQPNVPGVGNGGFSGDNGSFGGIGKQIGSLENQINQLKSKGDLSSTDQLKLQELIQKKNQLITLLTQLMQQDHQAKMRVLQNIR